MGLEADCGGTKIHEAKQVNGTLRVGSHEVRYGDGELNCDGRYRESKGYGQVEVYKKEACVEILLCRDCLIQKRCHWILGHWVNEFEIDLNSLSNQSLLLIMGWYSHG